MIIRREERLGSSPSNFFRSRTVTHGVCFLNDLGEVGLSKHEMGEKKALHMCLLRSACFRTRMVPFQEWYVQPGEVLRARAKGKMVSMGTLVYFWLQGVVFKKVHPLFLLPLI